MNARHFPLALAIGLLLLPVLPAAAQNAVTLYGGYAWGGSFEQTDGSTATADLAGSGAGAVSIDWALDSARNVQLFASGQRTTLQLPAGSVAAGSPTSLSDEHLLPALRRLQLLRGHRRKRAAMSPAGWAPPSCRPVWTASRPKSGRR